MKQSSWPIALVLAGITAVTAHAQSAKEVKLQDVWKSTAVGLIIQAPSNTTLVIQPNDAGTPFVLNGQRLVIRAAHVRLAGRTAIQAYTDQAAPAPVPGFSTAGPGGPNGGNNGGNGDPGKPGGDGRTGDPGLPAGAVSFIVGDIAGDGSILLLAAGEPGGPGQNGQEGGKGGRAGRGSDSADSWPNCDHSGGPAGQPGDGGPGGKGGQGGAGGTGGPVKYSAAIQSHVTVIRGGAAAPAPAAGQVVIDISGGRGGPPGIGGVGGDGGDGNDGGSGGGACGGGKGSAKKSRSPDQALDLGVGIRGPDGSATIIH